MSVSSVTRVRSTTAGSPLLPDTASGTRSARSRVPVIGRGPRTSMDTPRSALRKASGSASAARSNGTSPKAAWAASSPGSVAPPTPPALSNTTSDFSTSSTWSSGTGRRSVALPVTSAAYST